MLFEKMVHYENHLKRRIPEKYEVDKYGNFGTYLFLTPFQPFQNRSSAYVSTIVILYNQQNTVSAYKNKVFNSAKNTFSSKRILLRIFAKWQTPLLS